VSKSTTVRDGLDTQSLTVRFGGLLAVDRVSLSAPKGRLTGLIGPNGAGKTTIFNACTGLLAPSEGRIRLLGDDVTFLGVAARAGRGLGRTFQRMELFDSMTVAENIALGREGGLAGRNPWRLVVSNRQERFSITAAAEEALGLFGLGDLRARRVADLSTGQRRLTELARAYAGESSLLLLDEPSSGLDQAETATVGCLLRQWVERQGVGILLVEHDMSLVMGCCDYVYVLDFGKLIFQGATAEVQESKVVQAAYLGTDTGVPELEVEVR
jgi:ABC-type branched-subunit amino acid transport system ATPase component